MDKKFYTLEEVARAAEAAATKHDGSERRRFPRKAIAGALNAALQIGSSPAFTIQLRDLSRGGIGFFSDRHIPRNEQALIIAALPGEEMRVVCHIKRCYLDKTSNRYIVGAEIAQVSRNKTASRAPAASPPAPLGPAMEPPPELENIDAQHLAFVHQRLHDFLRSESATVE